MYAFPSFPVCLYLIGRAKSVPTTSKAVAMVERSFGNIPGAGPGIAVACYLLHPLYLLRIRLTRLRNFGIQYLSRTAAIVRPTPPWSTSR